MTRPLRVGVIGLGVGEQHLAAYHRHPDCVVAAVCDLSSAKVTSVLERYPGLRTTSIADEILLAPDIDVVSIASYDDAHAGQVTKALDAEKHVFVEKPLCRTIGELRAIKDAWARHDGRVKLMSNLVLRAAPAYCWLKARVQAGDFGEVYAFDGDYLYGRLHKITEGWRKDVDGYSVIEGGGVHLIDLMVWLTGERPTRASSIGNRISSRGTAFRYDDYVASHLECPSGMLGRISANFGSVHPHQHVVRLFGTAATFVYDDNGPRWYRSRDPLTKAARLDLPALPGSKGDLIGGFVDAIINDLDLNPETEMHFNVISISSACETSLQTGAPSDVEYV